MLPGDNAVLFQNCAQLPVPTEYEVFNNGNGVIVDSSFMPDGDTDLTNGKSWLPDENSSLSLKCITFSNSTESEAFHNYSNSMPHSDVMGDTSWIPDAKVSKEGNCLPRANARLSEICIEYQEPSEMHSSGVLGNDSFRCDAQPSFPNLKSSFILSSEVDKIVPERNREESKVPWMNLLDTKTSHLSEDTLNALCVPSETKMQDVNDHDLSVLDDLMVMINGEENPWC